MSEPGTSKQQQPPPARPGGEVVVEVVDACNRSVLFGPKKVRLRGRWGREKLWGQSLSEHLTGFPDVPGMCVSIDAARRRGRIFDPLGLPEHAETLRQVRGAWRRMYRQDVRPEDERVYEDLSPTDVKSWLHYLRRLVDGGMADVVKGALPAAREIEALPGKTRVEYWNTSWLARNRYKEDQAADRERAERRESAPA